MPLIALLARMHLGVALAGFLHAQIEVQGGLFHALYFLRLKLVPFTQTSESYRVFWVKVASNFQENVIRYKGGVVRQPVRSHAQNRATRRAPDGRVADSKRFGCDVGNFRSASANPGRRARYYRPDFFEYKSLPITQMNVFSQTRATLSGLGCS